MVFCVVSENRKLQRTRFHKAWLPLRPASSEGRLRSGGLHVAGLQGSNISKITCVREDSRPLQEKFSCEASVNALGCPGADTDLHSGLNRSKGTRLWAPSPFALALTSHGVQVALGERSYLE